MTVTTSAPSTASASSSSTADANQDIILPSDMGEIQGMILRGYKMEYARHFVLQIQNVPEFKAFLGKLVPNTPASGSLTVTTAAPFPEDQPKPDYYLNIGLSWPGMQKLNLPNATFGDKFKFQAFKAGAVARAPQNVDTGASDPSNWLPPFGPANVQNAHAIVSLFAHTPESLDQYTSALRAMFETTGAAKALSFNGVDYFDAHALPNDTIHFGYVDGISQPKVSGMDARPDKQRELPAWGVVLRNTLNAPYPMPQPEILTRNSGFGVFRILEQDTHGFDTYIKGQGIDPELLAAKMCGRWRNGNPLALCPHAAGAPLPDDQLSNFDYSDDPNGDVTPIGSHTRRGNPKDSEAVVPVRPFNRIVRRGMPYGPAYEGVADDVKRGLVGWFIGASIEDQFEFIQKTWLFGENFVGDDLSQPKSLDPLFGGADPSQNTFDYPPTGHVAGFGQFVTTKGGMYCFLPSIPALTWMSQQV